MAAAAAEAGGSGFISRMSPVSGRLVYAGALSPYGPRATQGASSALRKILHESTLRTSCAANILEAQKTDTVPVFLIARRNVLDSDRDTGWDVLILRSAQQLEPLSILCAPARLTSAKNVARAAGRANEKLAACMVRPARRKVEGAV